MNVYRSVQRKNREYLEALFIMMAIVKQLQNSKCIVQMIFAARTGGILWKANPLTGKVETSAQFFDESEKKLTYMFCCSVN